MKKTFLNKCKKVQYNSMMDFNKMIHNGDIKEINLRNCEIELFKDNMLKKEYYFLDNGTHTINTDLNRTIFKKYEYRNKQFILIIENLGIYQCITKNTVNYYIKFI